MVSKYGGLALMEQLTARTAAWAVLQTALEAGRRTEARLRATDADPDRLISLFHLGFELDEALSDRLREHKGSGASPTEALPALREVMASWDPQRFEGWLELDEAPPVAAEPAGRRLTGRPPSDPVSLVQGLASGLRPLSDAYPFPHYRNG